MEQKPIIVVNVNNQIPQLRETMQIMSEQLDDKELKIFLVANSNMERDIEFQCLNPVKLSDEEYQEVLERVKELEERVQKTLSEL